MKAFTSPGCCLTKLGANATWSVMIVGYCFVETSTCPFGFCSARDSHGCHVTATFTRPAAKAAPASPEVRSICFTSLSDNLWRLSTYASSHWLVEPALTATDWMPFAYVREYVSTVVAIAFRLPALKALKRCTGSSITV